MRVTTKSLFACVVGTVASMFVVISGCADYEGRVCATTEDCIDGYFCGPSRICVLDGTEIDGGLADGGAEDPDGGLVEDPDGGLVEDPDGGPDGGPAACPAGRFDQDDGPGLDCVPWTTCVPGQFVESEGTETTDRVCAGCAENTFSVVENSTSCVGVSTCGPGTFISVRATSTSDQECESCASGSYTSSPNQEACDAWAQCPPGSIQTAAGNRVSNPTCATCTTPGTYCPGGTAPEQPCADGRWDDDADAATACVPHTVACPPGTTFGGGEGTVTTDRECSVCVDGFSTTQDAPTCTPFTECSPGEFVDVQPTAQNDRSCAPCQASFSTEANAASCQPWTTCALDYEGFLGSPTRDQLCRFSTFFGTPESDRVNAVAVDAQNAVYVVGDTFSSFFGAPNFGGRDWFARRYTPSKVLNWNYFRGNADNNSPTGIAVADDAVVMTGTDFSDEGALDQMAYRIVDRFGDFARLDDGDVEGSAADDALRAVVVDDLGQIYLIGQTEGDYVGGANPNGDTRSFVAKYNETLTSLEWREGVLESDSAKLFAATVLVDGIVAVGSSGRTNPDSVMAVKFDFAGNELWRRIHSAVDGSATAQHVIVDRDGNIVLFGTTSGAFAGMENAGGGLNDLFLMQLDPTDGDLVSVYQVGTPETDLAAALTIGPGGRIFAAANTLGAFPGETQSGLSDIVLLEFPTVGPPANLYQYGTNDNDFVNGIGATATEIVLVGRSAGSFDGKTNEGSFDAFIQWITLPD